MEILGKYECDSIEDTQRVAGEFAKLLGAGDVVCLNGELGAGKTAFAAGVAYALGYTGHAGSPTFTIANEYDTIPPVYHLDVYRLSGEEEAETAGIDEYLFGGGVCLVEWAENIRGLIPNECYMITLRRADNGENSREITITKRG